MENALERREQIAERLRFRRRDNVRNLAAEFGVTERTIRSDLITLSMSYPIVTVQGCGGGVIWKGKRPVNVYTERDTGGNTPPDCASVNGHIGIDAETGEVKDCKDCPNNKFGSGENGAKACKQKRRIYILRAGEALPIILSLPTGSLADFSKYITRLLSKGQKSSTVVTKFSLKKAQNAGGISYSQAVLSVERNLTADESVTIERLAEQVKAIAQRIPETAIETKHG